MKHENPMDCENAVKNLNAYIDNELDIEHCSEIEDHIQNCPNCQVVINTLKKTIDIYRTDGKKTHLPSDVRKRLYACFDLDETIE